MKTVPMTLSRFLLTGVAFCLSFAVVSGAQPNTLTSEEKAAGWQLLFDGKSMRNWQDPSKKTPPGDAWSIEDGSLKATSHPQITEDLVSNGTYTDFELMWDWKIAPGSNSGLKYRIQAFPIVSDRLSKPGTTKFEQQVDSAMQRGYFDRKLIQAGDHAQIYVIGFEYQLIDNERHRDALRGGKYQAGALYDILAPSTAAAKPVGDWNTSKLVVKGNHIEHWLNGVKVVDSSLDDPAVKESSAKRWGAESPVYKLLTTRPKADCPISLQNHGDNAWFRNIKIRPLK